MQVKKYSLFLHRQQWGLRKSQVSLVKSSLVFVLVEGGPLAALKSCYRIAFLSTYLPYYFVIKLSLMAFERVICSL